MIKKKSSHVLILVVYIIGIHGYINAQIDVSKRKKPVHENLKPVSVIKDPIYFYVVFDTIPTENRIIRTYANEFILKQIDSAKIIKGDFDSTRVYFEGDFCSDHVVLNINKTEVFNSVITSNELIKIAREKKFSFPLSPPYVISVSVNSNEFIYKIKKRFRFIRVQYNQKKEVVFVFTNRKPIYK